MWPGGQRAAHDLDELTREGSSDIHVLGYQGTCQTLNHTVGLVSFQFLQGEQGLVQFEPRSVPLQSPA